VLFATDITRPAGAGWDPLALGGRALGGKWPWGVHSIKVV